jgi:hypothetical protein
MTDQLVVRTSDSGWLARLASAYRDQTPALIIDDAHVGIDPSQHSLFDMGRTARLTGREIGAVCISCGMSLAGAGMVLLAFLDPEPTSKLGLLIASGALLAFTGGWSAIQVLTKNRPPNVRVTRNGVEISWS